MAQLTFWFELASTYSYLSAMRLPGLAAAAQVEVVWRPFLLGPIFKSQGWNTSPFKVYPAKGAYMWRDMARQAKKHGLSLKVPDNLDGFPRHSVLAARMTIVGLREDWGMAFAQGVYTEEFSSNADISDQSVLQRILTDIGIDDPQRVFKAAQAEAVKAELRANTQAAQAMGIFGAPSFSVGDELFWGDDRLEDALLWAANA